MNCCDYDCTQGRDCPARQKPTPADELQRLQGEARVIRGLLRQCAEVLCTVEPKSDTEGEELYALLHGCSAEGETVMVVTEYLHLRGGRPVLVRRPLSDWPSWADDMRADRLEQRS